PGTRTGTRKGAGAITLVEGDLTGPFRCLGRTSPPGRRAALRLYGLRRQQLPEPVLEDAAVAVVLGLLGRVDAHERAELGRAAVLLPGPHRHAARLALGPERRLDTLDLVELAAREPQRLRALARLELERQHPHAHQVGAVDPLEALRQHRAHA